MVDVSRSGRSQLEDVRSRSSRKPSEDGNHLPGPTVLRQEGGVTRPNRDYLRTTGLLAIDYVAWIKATQPRPMTHRPTSTAILARPYVDADKIRAVIVDDWPVCAMSVDDGLGGRWWRRCATHRLSDGGLRGASLRDSRRRGWGVRGASARREQ